MTRVGAEGASETASAARQSAAAAAAAAAGSLLFLDARVAGAKVLNAVALSPRPGLVALWPPWLYHQVAPTSGTQPRIAVSFNVGMTTRGMRGGVNQWLFTACSPLLLRGQPHSVAAAKAKALPDDARRCILAGKAGRRVEWENWHEKALIPHLRRSLIYSRFDAPA